MYKVYNPSSEAEVFYRLTALKNFLDLSINDTKKCFYPGVHTTEDGDTIITYE
jgi:hypothetical protein